MYVLAQIASPSLPSNTASTSGCLLSMLGFQLQQNLALLSHNPATQLFAREGYIGVAAVRSKLRYGTPDRKLADDDRVHASDAD
jgi:hypothetical protein